MGSRHCWGANVQLIECDGKTLSKCLRAATNTVRAVELRGGYVHGVDVLGYQSDGDDYIALVYVGAE